MPVAP
jgi:hypothetical protein